jgi:hypothetical protein
MGATPQLQSQLLGRLSTDVLYITFSTLLHAIKRPFTPQGGRTRQ